MGDITIDYKRGSGYIYGKIVKKDEKDSNPDWRGMYSFLKEKICVNIDKIENSAKVKFNYYSNV